MVAPVKARYEVGRNAVLAVPNERWELDDRYSHVKSAPIIQHGINTGYDMVYKAVRNKGEGHDLWTPIGSVGQGWTPVETTDVEERLIESLYNDGLIENTDVPVRRKLSLPFQKSTMHRIDIPLDIHIEMPTRDDDVGSMWANSDGGDGRTYQPTATLFNGYGGERSLQFGLSMFRLICKNGMVVPCIHDGIRRRHTFGGSTDFMNYLKKYDFSSKGGVFKEFMQQSQNQKVTSDILFSAKKHLSRKDVTAWRDYPGNNVSALLNFLTYQQTHVASVTNESRYQKAVNAVSLRMAA